MTRRVDTLHSYVAQPLYNANIVEWDPTITYPTNATLTIPDHADFNVVDGISICFDMYLANGDDTNIICKYNVLNPEWWFGIYQDKLVFLVWDTALDAYGSTSVDIDEFLGKWIRVSLTLSLNVSSGNMVVAALIAPLGCTSMEALAFNGGTFTVDDSTMPVGTRNISTNDILVGVNGRVRDLHFVPGYGAPPDFFTDPTLAGYSITHRYYMNEGSGVVADDSKGTNDGTYDISVEWDNQQEDCTVVPSATWADHIHFGVFGNVAILDRDPMNNITSCDVQRLPGDARNTENYTIPGAPRLLSVGVEPGTGNAILYFEDQLKALKRYSVSAIRDLNCAPPVFAGLVTTFNIDETDLPDYAIDKVSQTAGAINLRFNFNIRPAATVTGVNVAWIDYGKDYLTIWTNDAGRRTIVISGLSDTAGNILEDQTINVTLSSLTRTFDFMGRTILEQFVVQDDLESKVSRNNRNYAEAELE